MKERALAIALSVMLATSPSFAGGLSKTIPFDGSGPFERLDLTGPQVRSSALLTHNRNKPRFDDAPASDSYSYGDVVVIVDNGRIVNGPRPANPVDLSSRHITFTPTAGGFTVAASETAGIDTAGGVPLQQGDDTTVEVPLGFSFPFLGGHYSSVFVNSDGNLTFGAGDSAGTERNAARLVGGPPRVAPFLADLDVTSGGSIKADARPDRFVVTWSDVPEYGTGDNNTFQVTLHASGRIEFAYGGLGTSLPHGRAVAGIAEGHDEGPFGEVDLTSAPQASLGAGAIFEEFHPAHGRQVDVMALAREFYRTHGDKYDFLVAFTNFSVDLQGAFAYEITVKNQTRGIGLPVRDDTALFGSRGELESFIMMNDINLYWPDERKLADPPIDMFRLFGGASWFLPPGPDHISRRARLMGTGEVFGRRGIYNLGLSSPVSVLAHEVMHRWGAFVPFVHPTKGVGFDSYDLLGRGFVHWSFFLNARVPDGQFSGDTRASSMEGNSIIDFGGNVFGDCRPGLTRFRTEPNELTDGYTELDQYLMGVRRDTEVGPFWYVDEPTLPASGAPFEYFREFPPWTTWASAGSVLT